MCVQTSHCGHSSTNDRDPCHSPGDNCECLLVPVRQANPDYEVYNSIHCSVLFRMAHTSYIRESKIDQYINLSASCCATPWGVSLYCQSALTDVFAVGGIGATIGGVIVQEFMFFHKITAISLVWLIGSLVTDIVITCALVWYLVRLRLPAHLWMCFLNVRDSVTVEPGCPPLMTSSIASSEVSIMHSLIPPISNSYLFCSQWLFRQGYSQHLARLLFWSLSLHLR